jgi:predicted transcriptional regulator
MVISGNMGQFLQRSDPDRRRIASMSEHQTTPTTIELAAEIVSAFMSNNPVPAAQLPALIGAVHDALTKSVSGAVQPAPKEPKEPAVPIKRSVQPDYVICLEDGKRFKSLKRHLRTVYDLTPDQYRAKWGLPHDYPMVAPNYAAVRSEMAKSMGLGARRRAAADEVSVQDEAEAA